MNKKWLIGATYMFTKIGVISKSRFGMVNYPRLLRISAQSRVLRIFEKQAVAVNAIKDDGAAFIILKCAQRCTV